MREENPMAGSVEIRTEGQGRTNLAANEIENRGTLWLGDDMARLLGIEPRQEYTLVAIPKGEAKGAVDRLIDCAANGESLTPEGLRDLVAAARAELALRDEGRVVRIRLERRRGPANNIFEIKEGGGLLYTGDLLLAECEALFGTCEHEAEFEIRVRHLPGSEPEKSEGSELDGAVDKQELYWRGQAEKLEQELAAARAERVLGEGRVVEVDVEVRDGGYTWVGTEYGPDIPDVLSDTLGNGHYTITRQPDKEPEKVQPVRLPNGVVICPHCGYFYENIRDPGPCNRESCPLRGKPWGEPRDLLDVP